VNLVDSLLQGRSHAGWARAMDSTKLQQDEEKPGKGTTRSQFGVINIVAMEANSLRVLPEEWIRRCFVWLWLQWESLIK
jgi:hypothetical protein